MFFDRVMFEKIKVFEIVMRTNFVNENILVSDLKENIKDFGTYSSAIKLFDCEPIDMKVKQIYKNESIEIPLEIRKKLRNIRKFESE